MFKLFFLSILFISQLSFAGVIKNTEYFKTIGSIQSFQWAPTRYESNFRYDIFYYIPEKLRNLENVPSLIFHHGGGQSTMTREGSISAVKMYINDFKNLADQLGFIAILPSANGLNWGGHTRELLKDLTQLMNKDLAIQPNLIGWAGHSMGAMGITRTFMWSTDHFAFIVPMAGGMDDAAQTEENLNKVFNVPYVHLQGKNDHFRAFVTRTEAQVKNTQALEAQYGLKSKLEAIFYNGSHNYDIPLVKTTLDRLFKTPRDLYQKNLFGSFYVHDKLYTYNNIQFHSSTKARYFWVEAIDYDKTLTERVDFRASINNNKVEIKLLTNSLAVKTLRVYLSSKLVDLNKNVDILLNGNLVKTRHPGAGRSRVMDEKDPGFIFDDYVDLDI